MMRFSLAKLAASVGAAAFALGAASGIASADPVIDTTCNYGQVMAALRATDPTAAAKVDASPVAQGWLSSFLAAGPAERVQKAQQLQAMPGASAYVGLVQRVAAVCNNY